MLDERICCLNYRAVYWRLGKLLDETSYSCLIRISRPPFLNPSIFETGASASRNFELCLVVVDLDNIFQQVLEASHVRTLAWFIKV